MSNSKDVSKKIFEDMLAKTEIFSTVVAKKEAGVLTGDGKMKFSFDCYDLGSQNKAAPAALAIAGPAAPAQGGDQDKKIRDLEEKIDRLQKGQEETKQFVGGLANHVKNGFKFSFAMINASNKLAFENNTKRGDRTDGLVYFDTQTEQLISFQDGVVAPAKNKALPGSIVLLDSDDEDSAAGSKSKVAPAKTKAERKAALLKELAGLSDDEDHAAVPKKKKLKQVDPFAAKKILLKEMMDFAKLSVGSQEILDKASALDSTLLNAAGTRLKPAVAKVFSANKAKAPLMNYCLTNPFKVASDAKCEKYLDFLQANGFPRDIDFDGVGYDWATHRVA
jgi:hypothetical protein